METPPAAPTLRPLPPPEPARPSSSRWAELRRIGGFALDQALRQNLTQVAASLTFTTVLSIVPFLAVILALFTAFPLFGEFRLALESFLANSLLPPAVAEHVLNYLNQFAAKASQLTAVGSLFLIVTSVTLIRTIDDALNNIWAVPQQRPVRQRLLLYWAILSLGPILAGFGLWAVATLVRESLGYAAQMPVAVNALLSLVPLVLTSLAFTALFMMVPNRSVWWRDALIGGVGTALVLEAMRSGFTYYLTQFPSYTVIYGAFATLPIFLLWVYLSWLVILLGAAATACLPALRERQWAQVSRPGAPLLDALAILEALWPPGRQRSAADLAQDVQRPADDVAQALTRLKTLGLLADTRQQDEDLWMVACDPRTAQLGPVVDALMLARDQPALTDQPHWQQAIGDVLHGADVTLASLFEPSDAPRPTTARP